MRTALLTLFIVCTLVVVGGMLAPGHRSLPVVLLVGGMPIGLVVEWLQAYRSKR